MQIGARGWRLAYVLVAAAFLAAVSKYYHPGTGFTSFIEFAGASHESEIPAVRDAPHYHHLASGGYDGQYYAQIAVEPLLRDPAIDRALDLAPYRTRRILFSWTAYALGVGNPAWILQAYALQNVVVWLALGWVLTRWMPPGTARHFALWSSCLLSHGMLSSVRYALPDGPCALLIAMAIAVLDAGPAAGGNQVRSKWRGIAAAALLGLAGLARETGILASSMFVRLVGRSPRSWLIAAGLVAIALLPLALWVDYQRSIYRSLAFESGGHVTAFLSGIGWKFQRVRAETALFGLTDQTVASLLAFAGFAVQGAIVLVEAVRSRGRSAWAMAALSFLVLALFTHRDVFAGSPGAFTRAFLPVALGANVILAARPRAPRIAIAAANLGVVPGIMLFFRGGG